MKHFPQWTSKGKAGRFANFTKEFENYTFFCMVILWKKVYEYQVRLKYRNWLMKDSCFCLAMQLSGRESTCLTCYGLGFDPQCQKKNETGEHAPTFSLVQYIGSPYMLVASKNYTGILLKIITS